MKYLLKKIGTLIITLFAVSLLAFLAFQIIPGDAATHILGTEATPERLAALRHEMGLDRPMMGQYFDWLGTWVSRTVIPFPCGRCWHPNCLSR